MFFLERASKRAQVPFRCMLASMRVCVCAGVGGCLCAHVCAYARMYALRIVWMDKILHFRNTFIINYLDWSATGCNTKYSSHLLPHRLWYSSSIPLWVASSLSLLGLRYSVFLGWAGGYWGRDPFNASDLWSGTLFLSVGYSLSLSSFKSKLKTHLFFKYTDLLFVVSVVFFLPFFSFFFLSFYQHVTSNNCNARIFVVCVCDTMSVS